MEMRTFGKLGISCSAFGLGCMRFTTKEVDGKQVVDEEKAIDIIRTAIDSGVTYIDTAYVYLDRTSETILGKALQDGYRDKVTIATKLPSNFVKEPGDMEKILNEELEKLQTDHIDFYLAHGLNHNNWKYMKDMGVLEFFDRMKAEGKIRYACFSFHDDYKVFEEILNAYDWDMVQIQYNFMDINNQAGTKGLKLAASKNIPVVIMEGLLGGRLAKAPAEVQALYDAYPVKRSSVEWAFRWLMNHPEVKTVLSGCNEVEQVLDNVRIFNEDVQPGCMSEDDLKLIDKVREAYLSRTKIGCTGCRYCMPCPGGVDIPGAFAAWNQASLYDEIGQFSWGYDQMKKAGTTPERCLECGACEAACPQALNIIESLKLVIRDMDR